MIEAKFQKIQPQQLLLQLEEEKLMVHGKPSFELAETLGNYVK